MGKAEDTGPKKLDSVAQKSYKEFGVEQAKNAPLNKKVEAPKDQGIPNNNKGKKKPNNWRTQNHDNVPYEGQLQ